MNTVKVTGYSPIDFFRGFEAHMKAHMLQASKGFGFCSYATTQAATMAIKGMNGATLGTNDIGPWIPWQPPRCTEVLTPSKESS